MQKGDKKIDVILNILSIPIIFENCGRIEVKRAPKAATEKRAYSIEIFTVLSFTSLYSKSKIPIEIKNMDIMTKIFKRYKDNGNSRIRIAIALELSGLRNSIKIVDIT